MFQQRASGTHGIIKLRMTKMFSVVAIFVMLQMVPGSGEMFENIVHLVQEGHLAHALPDAAHQDNGPEHGCSGPFHFCHCHTSTVFLLSATDDLHSVQLDNDNDFLPPEDPNAKGYLSDIFRPPKA